MAAGISPDSVRGATDAEIDRFAARQGVTRVPSAVREILRLVGNGPGFWFDGAAVDLHGGAGDAERARLAARIADHSTGGIRDPLGMLVLTTHQGYRFHIIDGADLDRDDPPVWEFVEDEGTQRWATTSEWFKDLAPRAESLRRQLEWREQEGQSRPEWADFVLSAHAATPPATNPADRVRRIVEQVFEDGLRRDSVRGATVEEIADYLAAQGVPEVGSAIGETLRLIGARPGLWLSGFSFGVHGPDATTKAAVLELLSTTEHDIADPEGLLVLATDDDAEHIVIAGSDTALDDPAVWRIDSSEPTPQVRKAWGSVTGWLDTSKPNVANRRLMLRAWPSDRPSPKWAADIEPE
ncbi:SMI1/KNR4 family protein [Nocardia sp. NPDC003693]